jgi:hypothetical protein
MASQPFINILAIFFIPPYYAFTYFAPVRLSSISQTDGKSSQNAAP